MKRYSILASSLLLLCLWGCEKIPEEGTIPTPDAPIQHTTVPTTTTLSETTVPTDAPVLPQPTEPPIQAEHIILQDRVPEYGHGSDKTVIKASEESVFFSAQYIHFYKPASETRQIYNEGVVWICAAEQESKSNWNPYQLYALEDGQLKKLQNKQVSGEYTFRDQTVRLNNKYAIHNGTCILTHTPLEETDFGGKIETRIINFEKGPKECLVKTSQDLIDGYFHYFFLVDLNTGKSRDFLADFDLRYFMKKDYTFLQWTTGYSFIAREGTMDNPKYFYFDVPNKTVTEIPSYCESVISDPAWAIRYEAKKDRVAIYDPVGEEKIEFILPENWITESDRYWRLSPDGRYLMSSDKIGNVYHFLIFDANTNTLYELQRENPNDVSEGNVYWSTDNEIVIDTMDRQAIYLYNFINCH